MRVSIEQEERSWIPNPKYRF